MNKYKPSRDLPKLALENRTLQPSVLRTKILEKYNKSITPESISMWFIRNPKVYTDIQKQLIDTEIDSEEVAASIFQNGTFEELMTVKNWIAEMKDRKLSETTWKSSVRTLKRVCKGKFKDFNLVELGLMNFKHPDRLVLKDAQEISRLVRDQGLDPSGVNLALRNFLESKSITVGKKISGSKHSGFGKLAHLFVEKETLNHMLNHISRFMNYEAYVISLFMFKTGTRITATLNAKIENLSMEGDLVQQIVFDKARRSKHPKGKRWVKHIPKDLYYHMKGIIGDRIKGKIFSLSAPEMAQINRAALKRFVPELEPQIRMPNHFWRHMFFQHMLRITDWKYGVVASLGGSTVSSLQESYGMPPKAIVQKWGLEYVPEI